MTRPQVCKPELIEAQGLIARVYASILGRLEQHGQGRPE